MTAKSARNAPKLRLVTAKSGHKERLDGARRWDALSGDNSELGSPAGERLRILQIALGYSEAEMAAKIGISIQLYRRWATCGKIVRKFCNLVDFIGDRDISLDWLLYGDANGRAQEIGERVVIMPALTPKGRQRRAEREAEAICSAYSRWPRAAQLKALALLFSIERDLLPA